jgi:hypothetical protein
MATGPSITAVEGTGSKVQGDVSDALPSTATRSMGSTATHSLPADAPVEVGFVVVQNTAAAAKAVGDSALVSGDGATQAEVAAGLVNANGGLAGHKIKPIIYEVNVQQSVDSQEQAACARFFQDNHAIAVVSVGWSSAGAACAEKYHAPFVTASVASTRRAVLDKYPLAVLIDVPVLDAVPASLVSSLVRRGWFKPAAATEVVKIGLVYTDSPDFAAVPGQVRTALAAEGMTLTDTVGMPPLTGTNYQAAATAGESAALRFSSDHINRVLVVDAGGSGISWFSLAAGQDMYYPRYGATSLSEFSLWSTSMTARQLAGAAGLGWEPIWDLPVSKQPPGSANTRACVAAMSKAGEDMNTQATRASAMLSCEGADLLAAAWRTGPLTESGFLSGLNALGRRYSPVIAMATDFGGHRDGASVARPVIHQAACNCFVYDGPAQPLRQ